MTLNRLVSKLKFTEADFKAIQEEVKKTEEKTNGEIAIELTPESSTYAFYELFFSVCFGALVFTLLVAFNKPVNTYLSSLLWQPVSWFIPAVYGGISFLCIALCFIFVNIPAIDRIVIPKNVQKTAVYNKAIRQFVESGVYKTKEHSGILIYISWVEKEVRIIADSGISSKIDQEEWDAIASGLALGCKNAQKKSATELTKAILVAISCCSNLLAEYFPPLKENPNELPDGLILVEGGE